MLLVADVVLYMLMHDCAVIRYSCLIDIIDV